MHREHDEPGVWRATVDPDGTEHVEFVPATDPRLSRLAAVIEDQLTTQLATGTLGPDWELIKQDRIPSAALSIAEEVDYYFHVSPRENSGADARARSRTVHGFIDGLIKDRSWFRRRT